MDPSFTMWYKATGGDSPDGESKETLSTGQMHHPPRHVRIFVNTRRVINAGYIGSK